MSDVVDRLDSLGEMTKEEQVEFGKAVYGLSKLEGWEMIQAFLRRMKANAGVRSLEDDSRPREYYKGVVDTITEIQASLMMAVQLAEEEAPKSKLGARGVLEMLRPGGGPI